MKNCIVRLGINVTGQAELVIKERVHGNIQKKSIAANTGNNILKLQLIILSQKR